jgi:hypothetical protein
MSAGSVSFSGTAWTSLVICNLCCWVCGPQVSGGCTCSDVMGVCTDDADMPICCAIWTTCFHGDVSSIAPISSVVSSTGVFCVLSPCVYIYIYIYVCVYATCYSEHFHVIVHFLQEAHQETYICVTTCLWHCGCSWLTRWVNFDVIEANRKWQNDMGHINRGTYTCGECEIFYVIMLIAQIVQHWLPVSEVWGPVSATWSVINPT